MNKLKYENGRYVRNSGVPLVTPTQIQPSGFDDPARFSQIMRVNSPSNPFAVASVVSGELAVDPAQVPTVLGHSIRSLLTTRSSILYNTTPDRVLALMPPITTQRTAPASGVKDAPPKGESKTDRAQAALAMLNKGGVSCALWNQWDAIPRENTLRNFGINNVTAAEITALCGASSEPVSTAQVGRPVAAAYVDAIFRAGFSCHSWKTMSEAVRRAAVRQQNLLTPDMVVRHGSETAALEVIAREITYECLRRSEDWYNFLRGGLSCASFLASSHDAQVSAFRQRGWRDEHIEDGISRLRRWCQQATEIEQAQVLICRTVDWRVRSTLIDATRQIMHPITIGRALPSDEFYRDQMESGWQRGLWVVDGIPSLPILSQSVYDHCMGNAGTRWQVAYSANNTTFRTSDGPRMWLSVGEITPQGGYDALDPLQGAVGDCYLISAMTSIVWSRPGLLETLVRRLGDGPHGTTRYSVRIRGEEQIIDDTFPISPFFFIPMYAFSNRQDAMWPALIEKAYAAWRTRDRTGTPNIAANNALYFGADVREDARRSVSNGIASVEFPAGDLVGGQIFWWVTYFRSGEACWRKISEKCNQTTGKTNTPMQAGTYVAEGEVFGIIGPSDIVDRGFVPGHAYSILGVSTSPKAVILRNPWGSYVPDASMRPAALRQWNRLNVTGDYHGVFAVTPEAFARYFGAVYGTDL